MANPQAKEILVLGAGMVGTCTAIHLALKGMQVTLIDRKGPGQETSYGNAGLIQSEAVAPHAFPHDLHFFAKSALKSNTATNYHLRAMPHLAGPLFQYWRNSAPERYHKVVAAYSKLIEQAIPTHAELISACGADALIHKEGWIAVTRTRTHLDVMLKNAETLKRDYNVPYQALTGEELAAMEPNLKTRLAGAVHWTSPWSVQDPGLLVNAYADYFQNTLGGRILKGDATTLKQQGTTWSVNTAEGWVEANQVVLALGPWTAEMTRRWDYDFPCFIKRGYHRHYAGHPLNHPMLDDDQGYFMAPMSRGLRITTGAEFALLGEPPTPIQLEQVELIADDLVGLGQPIEPEPWMGNRPCTSDMLPIIGQSTHTTGLWFNFGHAHQGFTLGPATGRLIAEMIHGETPYIDPVAYSPERFA